MASFALRRAYVRAIVAIAATASLALSVAAPSGAAGTAWIAKADSIRIMALGDSITAGVGAHGADIGGGGYRGELETLLDAAGYHYEMIGSRSDFSGRVRAPAHEGWPGYVVRSLPSDPGHELLGPVTANAVAAYDPDVILLMAGTNDLLRLERHAQGYTVVNIVASMDALLDQIFFERPRVHLILAGVVNSPDIGDCTVERFDGVPTQACGSDGPSLVTLVDKYRKLGFDIVLAPRMDAAVPRDRDHFPDGIHPSGAGGYAAVARVWMSAIAEQTRPAEAGNVAVTKP